MKKKLHNKLEELEELMLKYEYVLDDILGERKVTTGFDFERRLPEISQKYELSTPGEWEAVQGFDSDNMEDFGIIKSDTEEIGRTRRMSDAVFIVDIRQNLSWLVDAIKTMTLFYECQKLITDDLMKNAESNSLVVSRQDKIIEQQSKLMDQQWEIINLKTEMISQYSEMVDC